MEFSNAIQSNPDTSGRTVHDPTRCRYIFIIFPDCRGLQPINLYREVGVTIDRSNDSDNRQRYGSLPWTNTVI